MEILLIHIRDLYTNCYGRGLYHQKTHYSLIEALVGSNFGINWWPVRSLTHPNPCWSNFMSERIAVCVESTHNNFFIIFRRDNSSWSVKWRNKTSKDTFEQRRNNSINNHPNKTPYLVFLYLFENIHLGLV